MRYTTVSWRQRTVCVGLAIVASSAALLFGVSPAHFNAPSEQDIIAAKNGQRLQEMLDEARRPGTDFRLRVEQRVREAKAERVPRTKRVPTPQS